MAAAIALVVVLVGGGAWLITGPLRPGWSLHAGLPALTHGQAAHPATDRADGLAGPVPAASLPRTGS